jgi:hypothetical protein
MSEDIPPCEAALYIAEVTQQLAIMAEAKGLIACAVLLKATQREAEVAWALSAEPPSVK